jgi:TolB protein
MDRVISGRADLAASLSVVLAWAQPARAADTPAANDGKIAFSSDRDGNSEIYVMDADGSNPTNLTNDPADDLAPNWGSIVDTPLR